MIGMAKPKALIVRAPGTNCDIETAYAFELAGAEAVRVHVNQLIDMPALAESFQILCFPGGFSYGDDIAAGRIAAVQWQTRLADVLSVFRKQIAVRYCDADGQTSDEVLDFPVNPNGAQWNIAGICDPSGRIFGLMPHPERYLDPTNHPSWTRQSSLPEHGEGLKIFKNAVEYFA
jgi:phosphoribosylformylglycinamidine (FGAM) synthase-like amidotransferase family enzyme